MGTYTIPEIGKMIGRSRQYVNQYKIRGSIIVTNNGKVDLSNPINHAWFEKMKQRHIEEVASGKPPTQTRKKTRKTNAKTKQVEPKPSTSNKEPDQSGNTQQPKEPTLHSATSTAIKKAEVELRIKLLDEEKKKLEISRMNGQLLNMDVAKGIITSYMRMFSNELYRDIETHIGTVLDIYKVKLGEQTKHISRVEEIINSASDRTMREVAKMLENDEMKMTKK